jgi:hypothetical protein
MGEREMREKTWKRFQCIFALLSVWVAGSAVGSCIMFLTLLWEGLMKLSSHAGPEVTEEQEKREEARQGDGGERKREGERRGGEAEMKARHPIGSLSPYFPPFLSIQPLQPLTSPPSSKILLPLPLFPSGTGW